jgi:uncharacterized protein (DUF924 family)
LTDARSMSGAAGPVWADEVLKFWFQELGESRWFGKSDAIDGQIRDRFLSLHEQLVANEGEDITTPRPLLAAVIVLDQFSRNMFRGTPRAFATDPVARRLARAAIARGFDLGMTRAERMFLYLPFEHSEDRGDQALAVDLIRRLGHAEWTRYAEAHQAIIDRFGRFPHRNAILGRASTAEEIAALKEPMGSF